ncbi:MAG: colanic acid biosynthesis glycosyltransferase WcaL [Bacteroidetes bacterium]|nr:MAG: colanic acid biosynthesis glycosyltransferase WcaL [Bacteroidota bacterium]
MPLSDSCRVGYVLKRYPRFSETFIVNEILAHERAGLAVEIFALRPPTDTHFQDLIARVRARVHYLPEPRKTTDLWQAMKTDDLPGLWATLPHARNEVFRDVFQAIHLGHLAHRLRLTHLHAHFASSATSVTRLAARMTGLPFSFTAHAKDIFHESVDPEDLRRKLADARAVVTVSDFNLRFLQHHYGEAAGKVHRIYNGLYLPDFPFHAPDDRPRRIVAVGRLVEKKGFADLIAACALLKRRGRRFTCRIVGTGDLEPVLREQIAARDVADCVTLVGPLPQRAVKEEVGQAAVLAAPCVVGEDGNRDGLPTVLLEAMALGTPCVSTDVTGIPEVIRHDETGLLVPQHRPEALAGALDRLLHDAPLRGRLARAARSLIAEQFDVDANAARLRTLFGPSRDVPTGRHRDWFKMAEVA